MTRFIHTLFMLLLLSFSSLADIFPRFNQAGYASKAVKSCIVMSDENLENTVWMIKNKEGGVVLEGVFQKSISGKSAHAPKQFNYSIDFTKIKDQGKYKISIGDKKEFTVEVKNNPYDFIVGEMVSFLKKQRSGVPVAPDNEIGHPGDAKCKVYGRMNNQNGKWEPLKEEKHADMLGGWYDAGDYIKFTLTTAYTTYFLLRSYEDYPATGKSKEDKNALWEEAKWGLDYLLKTMPDDNTFIIQVGNADDHKQGNRMPYRDALNGQRHAYSALSPTQMGLTAAALALGASVINNNPAIKEKASVYKDKALKIYKKAASSKEPPAWFEEGWEVFYSDKTEFDNMQLAAVELYNLTLEEKFLDDAKMYATKAESGWWSSWANINMVSHLRLYKHDQETPKRFLEQDLNTFNGIAKDAGNIWGVPHAYTWASLYSFLGVGSAALQYNSINEGQTSYEKMGTDVLNYTLGMNNWGTAMVISKNIPNSVKNVYSQMYTIYPMDLSSVGAIAEGPGDKKTHDELMQYFSIPSKNKFDEFNTGEVVFYDYNTDFQCMETTIAGMADGIYFFTLVNKLYGKP